MVVGLSSLFLKFFGNERWQLLTLIWAAIPIIASILFCISPIPEMNLSQVEGGKQKKQQKFGLALCVACIFLGSAAENTMTNWISSYLENALGIPKSVGDILGMAVFAVLLGLGRILHAKYEPNIMKLLLVSMASAAVCYLIAGLSPNVILSFIACVLMGLCTSMLWPGSLILMEEKVSGVGVAAYALMAAGGDFGASVAPQLMGIIVDKVSISQWANELALSLSVPTEQISMKFAMLIAAAFPTLGVVLLIYMKKYFNKTQK